MNAKRTISPPLVLLGFPLKFFIIKHPSTMRFASIIVVLSKDATRPWMRRVVLKIVFKPYPMFV
jgi:hypothetical protein